MHSLLVYGIPVTNILMIQKTEIFQYGDNSKDHDILAVLSHLIECLDPEMVIYYISLNKQIARCVFNYLCWQSSFLLLES